MLELRTVESTIGANLTAEVENKYETVEVLAGSKVSSVSITQLGEKDNVWLKIKRNPPGSIYDYMVFNANGESYLLSRTELQSYVSQLQNLLEEA